MPQPQSVSPAMEAEIAQGPPYPPQVAGIGGLPTVSVDVPICTVFLCLYITSAVVNMFLFQRNRIRGHFFVPSALLFGFSMARILTFILRIVWATEHDNTSLAIAANIFVNAGILIVYIVNLLFAQRILRALQPKIGWHSALRIVFKVLYAMIGICLVLIIVLTVMSFYTLNPAIHSYALWIQRSAILYLFIVVLIPLVLVPLALLLPHSPDKETFGQGMMRTKITILMVGSCLCTIIAGFKVGVNWSNPRPIDDPAWYDSKPAFYCFLFMLEIFVLILYTGARIDKRFHVHDGSSKRKSFAPPTQRDSGDEAETGESDLEKRESGLSDTA